MDRNFQRALPLVLKHEGGYVDHPKDRGRATNKGVTIATFRRYVKADGTKADLKAITDAQVATVYYRHYWSAVHAAALPAGLDYATFDFAVNSGPSRAAKFLQAALGVTVDGRIGPETIAAATMANAPRVIKRLCADRLAWLKRLKDWKTFGRGWSSRVGDVESAALAMVGKPADVNAAAAPEDVPVMTPAVEAVLDDADKTLASSSTAVATGLGTVAGCSAAAKQIADNVTSIADAAPWAMAAIVIAGAGFWILRERHRKAAAARKAKAGAV